MPITNYEERYLKNKHKGGQNNSKGATYENYYATYQIALSMNKYINQMNAVYLSSQVELTFVDDLLIKAPNSHRTYHQLKNVADITWNTGKRYSLIYDFKRQIGISQEKGEDFSLKLVYSNIRSHVSEVPASLRPLTCSEYFPACKSINQLLLSFPQFKNAIQQIMVIKNAEDDELSGAASAILGAWCSMDQKVVSLAQISEIIYQIGKGYVNIKIFPTVEISDECQNLFHQFNLNFHANGRIVYWAYEKLKGEVLWSDETEKRLLDNNPIDIWSLIKELS